MLETLSEEIEAVRRNDPAARSALEALLCHTPLQAIILYRIAHWIRRRSGLSLFPRLISAFARFLTGVEIHPAAKIGRRFFIDHGTGVVIGETAEIGDDCVMFHNVTLGGTGKEVGKRHPTIENGVYIGTGAVLLGPIRVGSRARIGANTFIRMHDVPPDTTVVGAPAQIVKRDGKRVDEELPVTQLPENSGPRALHQTGEK